MTHLLPPSILAKFAPRPPIPFLPPIEKKKCPSLTGFSAVVNSLQSFEDPATVDYSQFRPIENKEQRKERKSKERLERHARELKQKIAEWNPQTNDKATGDPSRTLFVSRIAFETTESKLKREFEVYGPVKKVRLVQDLDGKSRGYGFVEFEREKDMRTAYKLADGKKIDGRRVLVDFERGRTQPNWKPRRLGGGMGGTRLGGDDVNQKFSGREPPVLTDKDRLDDRRERDDRRPRDSRDRGGRGDADRGRDRGGERGGRDRERHRSRSRERERDRVGGGAAGGGGDRSARRRSRSRERDRGDRGEHRGGSDRKGKDRSDRPSR